LLLQLLGFSILLLVVRTEKVDLLLFLLRGLSWGRSRLLSGKLGSDGGNVGRSIAREIGARRIISMTTE
jgi:hypothetical protein